MLILWYAAQECGFSEGFMLDLGFRAYTVPVECCSGSRNERQIGARFLQNTNLLPLCGLHQMVHLVRRTR